MSKVFKLPQANIEVELGRYAHQADGAVWMRSGNNVVLTCATASKEERDFMGFFPLTVEYRERMSAAGKIPGGYMKREGRLSDTEVLNSRITDRTIRPFFPSNYFNEVQVLSTVYSADGETPTNVMSIIGSSLALGISDMPFTEILGAVLVSRIDGKWAYNVSHELAQESDVHVLVAGTANGICMVEGNCDGLSEDEMIDLFFSAHEQIKAQVAWQAEIIKEVGKEKKEVVSSVDWTTWAGKVNEWFKSNDAASAYFAATKAELNEALSSVKTKFKEDFADAIESGDISSKHLSYLFGSALKNFAPEKIMSKGVRFDGRNFDTVRPIAVNTGLLPQVHGSATFRRGETEVLASLTLGTGQDAQKVDKLIEGTIERKFMLHYNFPPFSVGDVRPIRGVSRREIGHGYLAENSFKHVLPSQEDFPYTIRTIADVLSCNGSSSMATVCSTTMSMLDAGVPLKKMVAGVAMGLIQDSKGSYQVLTDILGSEDALGLMDFKVTGCEDGIRGIQMDIKAKDGLSKELMTTALKKAREARLHILGEMKKELSQHRDDVSALAPKVTSFKIDVNKIGAVIGPSGKIIKQIIAETDAQIDIEDDGTVKIYAKDRDAGLCAEQWVRVLGGDIPRGAVFNGIIRRIVEFGMFVELVPGKDGLLHISAISKAKQKELGTTYREGDPLEVKVVSYEKDSGRVKLVAPSLEN